MLKIIVKIMIDNLNFIIYTPFMKILIFLFINSREIFPDRLYKVKMGLTKCRIYFCDKENIEIVQ